MKSAIVTSILLFLVGCDKNKGGFVEDFNLPPSILCEVCAKEVSTKLEKCKNCDHPLSLTIEAFKQYYRLLHFSDVSEEHKQKQRQESINLKWGKEIAVAKSVDEVTLIPFPHLLLYGRFSENNSTKGFLEWNGLFLDDMSAYETQNTIIYDGRKPFTGWLKRIKGNVINLLVRCEDGFLNGPFIHWVDGWTRVEGKYSKNLRVGNWKFNYISSRYGKFSSRFVMSSGYEDYFIRKSLLKKYHLGEVYESYEILSRPRWKKYKFQGYGRASFFHSDIIDGKVNFYNTEDEKIGEQFFDEGRLISAIAWLPNGSRNEDVNVINGNGVVITYNKKLFTFTDGFCDQKKTGLLQEPVVFSPMSKILNYEKGEEPFNDKYLLAPQLGISSVEALMKEGNFTKAHLVELLNNQTQTKDLFSVDQNLTSLLQIFYTDDFQH